MKLKGWHYIRNSINRFHIELFSFLSFFYETHRFWENSTPVLGNLDCSGQIWQRFFFSFIWENAQILSLYFHPLLHLFLLFNSGILLIFRAAADEMQSCPTSLVLKYLQVRIEPKILAVKKTAFSLTRTDF